MHTSDDALIRQSENAGHAASIVRELHGDLGEQSIVLAFRQIASVKRSLLLQNTLDGCVTLVSCEVHVLGTHLLLQSPSLFHSRVQLDYSLDLAPYRHTVDVLQEFVADVLPLAAGLGADGLELGSLLLGVQVGSFFSAFGVLVHLDPPEANGLDCQAIRKRRIV